MPKLNVSLQITAQQDGGDYRLVAPQKNFFQRLINFGKHTILLPYYAYQTFVGRLLSYLIINPIFRADEKNEAQITQHPKHPDPLFSKQDEIAIINIYPNKYLLTRVIFNWHNFLINHLTPFQLAHSILRRLIPLLPSGKDSIEKYLDKTVERVVAKIEGNKGQSFSPNQIHFRGLGQLTDKQKELFYQKLEQRLHYDFRQNRQQVYFYTLKTTDNAVLDSVEVRGPDAAKEDISERHFIIAAMPRSNNYVDWIKNYQIYAKNLNATVIGFNYRGVGLSKGLVTNQESLYADAYAQAQRLLALGAKPENIAFMGECLGGNVATHTAGTLHKEGFPVKLYNARSFRSFSAIIDGQSKPSKDASLWSPLTWLSWLTYAVVQVVARISMHIANWDLNVEEEFTAIPPHDRDYLVVRSKKDAEGKRFADDLMIPHKNASTYSLIKEKIKALTKKKEQGKVLSEVEQEWLTDTPNQHKFYASEELHKDAHKANGHTAHPRLLISTNPRPDNSAVDGRQYAFNFFRRVWSKKDEPMNNPELNSAPIARSTN